MKAARRAARQAAADTVDAATHRDTHREIDPARRYVCVVLHDVAPARWASCTRLLGQLRRVAAAAGVEVPVTLLVVPMMHGVAASSQHYLRWLQRLADGGHELALHGLVHRDEGPPPQTLRERLLRQVYTAGEGEFAALDRPEAEDRIARGRAWAREHGLAMNGFVAPAWLLNRAGWEAVTSAGFGWTCTLNRIVALPEQQALAVRSLVFSTRSLWRRMLSLGWNEWLAWRQRHAGAPLLRLELHPADADHPALARCWQRLLASALQDRQPLRMSQAAVLARRLGTTAGSV